MLKNSNDVYLLQLSHNRLMNDWNPASILYKSIAGRYRPVSNPDGPLTARSRLK